MSDLIERAKAALEGVTEGPWIAADIDDGEVLTDDVPVYYTDPVKERQRPLFGCPDCGVRGGADSADAQFIAAARDLVPELVAEVERKDREHWEFTGRLGFGDNMSEPAASLADMVDPIESAFAEVRDHMECPHLCEGCGERLATTRCPDCHGSGCHGAMSANYGAYVECEQCGGAGWLHDECAEMTYADLVTELQRARAACKTLGDSVVRMNQDVLDITGLHHLIGEDGDGDWAAVWENLAERAGKP